MSANIANINNRKEREATTTSGMARDTPRFHRETRPWTFGSCLPPREAKLRRVRLEKHESRSACKCEGARGGGRYLQKVVSAASESG